MIAASVENFTASVTDTLLKSVAQKQKNTWRKNKPSPYSMQPFEERRNAFPTKHTVWQSLSLAFTLDHHVEPQKTIEGLKEKIIKFTEKLKSSFFAKPPSKKFTPHLQNFIQFPKCFLQFFGTIKWILHFLIIYEPAKLHKISINWES